MLQRLLRSPRAEVEVGVAVPIGCLVPLVAMLAIVVGISVGVGFLLRQATEPVAPREAVVRVIDDGVKPGPKILATAVVPLR